MQAFDTALTDVLTDPATPPQERRAALVRWDALPEARFAQPREEHLLPLHVVRAHLVSQALSLVCRRVHRRLMASMIPALGGTARSMMQL